MTYAMFLLLFVCIPLAGLAYLVRGKIRRVHLTMLIALATIAVVYTTPWDNYLVASGVWHYDPHLVMNKLIGYVPVEEYAFFILQTFLTGFFGLYLWQRFYPQDFLKDGKA